jgi:hypothetical protein
MRTVLIEASPWNPATGAVVTTRLAGGGRYAYTHRGSRAWIAGVVNEPKFTGRIQFDENGFSGGARPDIGALIFAPSSAAKLDAVAALLWTGAAIEVRVDDDEAAAPTWPILISGTVAEATIADGRLSLIIRDRSGALDVPVATGRFAGTGGIEGEAVALERLKRRSWGLVSNVEAFPLKSSTLIYEVGDPARPLGAITDVKDMGRSAGSITAVAWAGSIAATLAALEASTPAAGGCSVAPSIACLKWWTQPVGPLTVDLIGETGVGYLPSQIAVGVIAASGLTITNEVAAEAWRADYAGLHIGDENETIAQALDRLLKGVSLAWAVKADGTIELSQISFAGPIETVTAIDLGRNRTFKPLTRRRVGFLRNHRIHNDGEISAALRDDSGAILTAGADWATNVTSRPSNLAALSGSEGVNNAAISISSAGALAGAGGGQVTIVGLGYSGDLAATRGENLVKNPNFALGNLNYTYGDGAAYTALSVTTDPAAGGVAFPTTGLPYAYFNDTNLIPIKPGSPLYVSARVIGATASIPLQIVVNWYDAAGTYLGLSSAVGITTAPSAVWIEREGSFDPVALGVPRAAFATIYLQALGPPRGGYAYATSFRAAQMQQGATLGAAWGATLTGRPGNLAALLGSEGVNNALVSVAANGALSGAGGGQVTIGGLGYSGDLDANRNTRITISGGKLYSDATQLSASFIANSYVILTGVQLSTDNGATTLGAVVNSGVSIGSNGALAGGGGGQVTIGGLGYGGSLSATTGDNLILNPTSEDTTALGTYAQNGVVSGVSYSGSYCRKANHGAVLYVASVDARAGDQLYCEAMARNEVVDGERAVWLVEFRLANGTPVLTCGYYWGNYDSSVGSTSVVNSTSWAALKLLTSAAPAGTTYATIAFFSLEGGGSYGSFFDNLFATKAAIWNSGQLAGRPANLAALSGSEGVNNALVSIGASGALSGGGGGQVTIGGLGYLGDLNATRSENLVPNGDFASGQTGYALGSGAVYATLGAGYPAPHGILLPSGGGAPFAYFNNANAFRLAPGRRVTVSAMATASVAGSSAQLVVNFYDANTTFISYAVVLVSVPGSFGDVGGTVDVPANAALTAVYFQNLSTANVYGTNFRLAMTEPGADVTSLIQAQGGPETIVEFTYSGTVKAGQVNPRYVQFRLIRNGVDVSESATWSGSVISGTITATLSNSTGTKGLLNITADTTDAVLEITAVYQGATRVARHKVTKQVDPPPQSGGGGSGSGGSASGSITGTVSGTTMTAVGDELTVVVGSGGTVSLSADYEFSADNTTGSRTMAGRWEKWNGSAYVAIGSGDVAAASSYFANDALNGYGALYLDDTGNTNGSTQKYRFYAKGTSSSTNYYIFGDCSAVAS